MKKFNSDFHSSAHRNRVWLKRVGISIVLLLGIGLHTAWGNGICIDGIHYLLDGDSAKVTYTGLHPWEYSEYEGDITLPEQVQYAGKTYRVNAIGDHAFYKCYWIEHLTLSTTIVHIGEEALGKCIHLQSIQVKEGNPRYDSRNDCNGIVETATNTLVAACINTEIETDIQAIGEQAFEGLDIEHITLPDGLIRIDNHAFWGCSRLTEIHLPESVQEVGEDVFGETNIHDAIYNRNVLVRLPKEHQGEYRVADSTRMIAGMAMAECEELTRLILPNSIDSIGALALYQCHGLERIDVHTPTPPSVGGGCFEEVDKTIPLHVLKGTSKDYQSQTGWKEFKQIVDDLGQDPKDDPTEDETHAIKILRDGTIVIRYQGKEYDLRGARRQ